MFGWSMLRFTGVPMKDPWRLSYLTYPSRFWNGFQKRIVPWDGLLRVFEETSGLTSPPAVWAGVWAGDLLRLWQNSEFQSGSLKFSQVFLIVQKWGAKNWAAERLQCVSPTGVSPRKERDVTWSVVPPLGRALVGRLGILVRIIMHHPNRSNFRNAHDK
jgi:hypothetical protein